MTDLENGSARRKMAAEVDEFDGEPNYQPVDWKRLLFSWKYLPLWLVCAAIIALVVVISVDKNEIVSKLTPISQKIQAIPAGWLIPIAVLFVLSFPPLFGHEIVALLCGVVYGLWIGFGIVAAGTFIGEIGTWYAFKYALRRRALKLERTNLTYAALARLTRDTGFWMVVVVRLSVVPSHISTAVFSTCDVKFWHFVVATFLSLPKQLIVVYIGTLIVSGQGERLTKALVFIIGFGFTVAVSLYIWKKLRKYKAALLEEQEERRANRLIARQDQGNPGTEGSGIANGRAAPDAPHYEGRTGSDSREGPSN